MLRTERAHTVVLRTERALPGVVEQLLRLLRDQRQRGHDADGRAGLPPLGRVQCRGVHEGEARALGRRVPSPHGVSRRAQLSRYWLMFPL